MATAKKPAAKTAASSTALVPAKKAANAVGSVGSIKERLMAQAAAMADRVMPPGGNTISLAGNKFKLPSGVTTQDPQRFFIVDFVSEHRFFDRPFDKENPVPPACAAVGLNPRQLVPFGESPAIQADSCGECPNNQFGSSGKGKACSNHRTIALVPADAIEGLSKKDAIEALQQAPLWVLRTPPTSIRAFDSYVASLQSRFQLPPVAFDTVVSLDLESDWPVLKFEVGGPNEYFEPLAERQEEAQAMLMAPPDFSSYTAPAPVRQARTPAAAKKVAR